ncbi:hypothetical protein D3C76_1006680 [compost metagenome]
MSPSELLEKLKTDASHRVATSLDAVYKICQGQVDRGVTDFSFATIAKVGAGKGVPKAQSIRNKTGEPYRILISSFVNEFSNKKVGGAIAKDQWIEMIKDPALKMLVRMQQAELVQSKKMIKEIVPPGLEICIDDRKFPQGKHRLTSIERRALEYLLSDDFLRQGDLHVGEFGDVVNRAKVKIFKPGTLDALRKALEYL